LYFLPDRILVSDTTGIGALSFEQLEVSAVEQRFIEEGGVPPDAKVVDRTWRYVNKKGGPDRRFNDNQEIPIVLYEAIMLTSGSGVREMFQASRTGIGSKLNLAVKQWRRPFLHALNPKWETVISNARATIATVLSSFRRMVWGRQSPVHTAGRKRFSLSLSRLLHRKGGTGRDAGSRLITLREFYRTVTGRVAIR
jgi:hypothetical protein